MTRCAVLGDPISHSLSPLLHRAAYAALDLPWQYDAHRVAAAELAGFVGHLGSERMNALMVAATDRFARL